MAATRHRTPGEEAETPGASSLPAPARDARRAFENGAQAFQFSIEVLRQEGGIAFEAATDANAVLNSVCDQGWELVSGDFVFVQESQQQSRERFLSTAQDAAIGGRVLGYYLFRRSESNRRAAEDRERRRAQQAREGQFLGEQSKFFRKPPPRQ